MTTRRHALWWTLALATSGCGGGGGSTPTDDSSSGGATPPPPPPPPARDPNIAPLTGTFGGGQGQILFVDDTLNAKSVRQIDLATRTVSTLATPVTGSSAGIEDGISRAANGRIAVLTRVDTFDATSIVLLEADGTVALRVPTGVSSVYTRGPAVISPDAARVAFIGVGSMDVFSSDFNDYLRVYVLDVASGVFGQTNVLQSSDLADPSPTLAWTPGGELLLLTNGGLFRIDPVQGGFVQLHVLDLAGPQGARASADGASLWFHQSRGNPFGGTIWSIEIASGALARRSLRSRGWGQHWPVISPDGQWMLAQEGIAFSTGSSGSVDYYATAVRVLDPPLDVGGVPDEILDSAGERLRAYGRMEWW